MTATRSNPWRRRMALTSMESLGFIDTPATIQSTPPTDTLAARPSTRLVRKGRHVSLSGEPVRDLWNTTALQSPTLEDWRPASDGVARLAGPDFRWSLAALVAGLLLVAGLAVGYLLFSSDGASEGGGTADLAGPAAELADAVDVLASVVSPRGAGADDALAASIEVDRAARALFEATSSLPAESGDRARASQAVDASLQAARFARDSATVVAALEPVLTGPGLETDPALTDLATATDRFVAWLTEVEAVLEALPAQPDDFEQELTDLPARIDPLQALYLEAVGNQDMAGATRAASDLEAILAEIRASVETASRESAITAGSHAQRATDLLASLVG